jgi:hypothetical protein
MTVTSSELLLDGQGVDDSNPSEGTGGHSEDSGTILTVQSGVTAYPHPGMTSFKLCMAYPHRLRVDGGGDHLLRRLIASTSSERSSSRDPLEMTRRSAVGFAGGQVDRPWGCRGVAASPGLSRGSLPNVIWL